MSSFPELSDADKAELEEQDRMAGIVATPMRSLILIRGLPGSAKTTLARSILMGYNIGGEYIKPRCAHFEEDMFYTIATGKYLRDPNQRHSAEQWCRTRTLEAMKDNVNLIVVSNTFIRLYMTALYNDMAEAYGYNVQEIICTGNYRNVHGWTDEDIARMKKMFQLRPIRATLGNGSASFGN